MKASPHSLFHEAGSTPEKWEVSRPQALVHATGASLNAVTPSPDQYARTVSDAVRWRKYANRHTCSITSNPIRLVISAVFPRTDVPTVANEVARDDCIHRVFATAGLGPCKSPDQRAPRFLFCQPPSCMRFAATWRRA